MTKHKNEMSLARRAAKVGATNVYLLSLDSNYYYKGYDHEPTKMYEYTSLFLIHPDSVRLTDRVMQVEVYDEGDSTLLATAYFNRLEQLSKVTGDKSKFMGWFEKQPLFFMRQHNTDWQFLYG